MNEEFESEQYEIDSLRDDPDALAIEHEQTFGGHYGYNSDRCPKCPVDGDTMLKAPKGQYTNEEIFDKLAEEGAIGNDIVALLQARGGLPYEQQDHDAIGRVETRTTEGRNDMTQEHSPECIANGYGVNYGCTCAPDYVGIGKELDAKLAAALPDVTHVELPTATDYLELAKALSKMAHEAAEGGLYDTAKRRHEDAIDAFGAYERMTAEAASNHEFDEHQKFVESVRPIDVNNPQNDGERSASAAYLAMKAIGKAR